jgi:apolipoprotein N-acyltransferase
LIQPSIPQTLIWDTNQNALRFTDLIELSERALQATTNAQLLVWPEAAVPNMLRYEPEVYRAVTNLAITHRVWVILGSDDAAPRESAREREFDFFNSSFLVTPRGAIAGFYRKRRLVIFGEYIPLERWIPFMKYLTPVGGSFAAGIEPRPFLLPELGAKVSVLICFEDIFPHYSREYVEEDTDFLLNLTNNGWFGESAAQWQHAANAVFRAVENRIPLVRCANNGLTCWVDRWGRLHDVFFPNSKDIYGAGFKVAQVPVLGDGQRRALTFYTRQGDWFGWACVGGTVVLLAWTWGVSQVRARAENRICV